VDANDTTITIKGTGFSAESALRLNGLPWTLSPVTFVDRNTLRVIVPKAYFSAELVHAIAIQNPNSDLSNTLSLTVGRLAPTFTMESVVNAASYETGPVAPGEIVTIFGTNLEGQVTFDFLPATVLSASATQINVTVPYTVAGPSTQIRVGRSAPVQFPVLNTAPGIFAVVVADDIATIYATGCGLLTNEALPRCIEPVSVTINGQIAEVLYAGVAPGLPAGANQVNVRIPEGLSGSLTYVLNAGDRASKPFTR
jgi:hypothetical protein